MNRGTLLPQQIESSRGDRRRLFGNRAVEPAMPIEIPPPVETPTPVETSTAGSEAGRHGSRGNARRAGVLICALLCAPVAPSPVAAEAARGDDSPAPSRALTVSPGALERAVTVGSPSPAFSWGAVAGASEYHLAVFELPPAHPDDPSALDGLEPVLSQALPAGVTSWTPPLESALDPGGNYVWFVRAAGAAATEWSLPRLFRVAAAPSALEVEEALAVLARFERAARDARDAGVDRPDEPRNLAAATGNARAATAAERAPAPATRRAQATVLAAPAAFSVDNGATSGGALGMRAVSQDAAGAGGGFANLAGGAAVRVSGAGTDLDLYQDRFDRSSPSAESFSFVNSGGGAMSLFVGVEEVLDTGDLDSVVQRRVATECDAGEAMIGVSELGVPACVALPAGDITSVTAGTGLTGGGATGAVTLAVDPTAVQSRVSQSCAPGSSIRVIGITGTVDCEPDDNAGGDITGITTSATSGLLGGCTFGTCFLSVDPTDFNGSGPIVHADATGGISVTGTTATLDSVTITVPTGGTILVIGSATARATSLDSTNTLAIGDLGLTTVPTSTPTSTTSCRVEARYSLAATGPGLACTVHDNYPVGAGTHTYYLRATTSSGDSMVWSYADLSAIFIPN